MQKEVPLEASKKEGLCKRQDKRKTCHVEVPACMVSRQPSFIPSSCERKAFMTSLSRIYLPFLCCWDGQNLYCSYITWSMIPDFLARILNDMIDIYAVFCHSWLCQMLRQIWLGYSVNLISLEIQVVQCIQSHTVKDAVHTQCFQPYHCRRWILQHSEVQFPPPPLHYLLKISIDLVLVAAVSSKRREAV